MLFFFFFFCAWKHLYPSFEETRFATRRTGACVASTPDTGSCRHAAQLQLQPNQTSRGCRSSPVEARDQDTKICVNAVTVHRESQSQIPHPITPTSVVLLQIQVNLTTSPPPNHTHMHINPGNSPNSVKVRVSKHLRAKKTSVLARRLLTSDAKLSSYTAQTSFSGLNRSEVGVGGWPHTA